VPWEISGDQEVKLSIRIIDNKKIEVTADEWDMYEKICRSYDRPNYKGEELFVDLFETDDEGIIVFLKPPSQRFTSMEVFLFLTSLFIHQHMRQVHNQTDKLHKRLEDKLKELEAKASVDTTGST